MTQCLWSKWQSAKKTLKLVLKSSPATGVTKTNAMALAWSSDGQTVTAKTSTI